MKGGGGIIQHTSNVRGKGGRGGGLFSTRVMYEGRVEGGGVFSTRVMYEGRVEGGGGGGYSAHE